MDPELYQGMRNPNLMTAPGVIAGILWLAASIVLITVSLWLIFRKAGQPGWAALLPVYNLVVLVRVAGRPVWWFLMLLVPFIQWPLIWIVVLIDLARRFGKGPLFGVGMAFFGLIFFPVLAFSRASYQPSVAKAA